MEFYRGAESGAGSGTRGGEALFTGEQQVVERRKAWRISGLQPEREGSDHVLRVFGEAAARCTGEYAAQVGRGDDVRSCRLHGADGAGAAGEGWGSACGDGSACRG